MEMLEEHLCIKGTKEENHSTLHDRDETRPYLYFINFPLLKVIIILYLFIYLFSIIL